MVRFLIQLWEDAGAIVPRWIILLGLLHLIATAYVIGHFIHKYW